MQIIINVPQELEHSLLRQAEEANISLQALILKALHQVVRLSSTPSVQWSEAVLAYDGISDFPRFESYRDELLLPSDVELF